MASADAMEATRRVQDSMSNMINELDKSHIRRIQQRMHECAAKCCKNESASMEEVHGCIEKCSAPVHKAQNTVQADIGRLQERIQRCVLDCQDKARDSLDSNSSDTDKEKATRNFEKCAIVCVEDHLKMIPSVMKKVKSDLNNLL